ncbi:hydroxyethylthiazole kinase [Niallia sp. NCCP-28]|uniref:hydroxyethylthiazole kinase n=1 Tax=Niallia sp. NCCP-28 TaxID=2934712 RepID=UPI0035CF7662
MKEVMESGEILNRLREKNPLIHNITNVVVTNFTANGLLAIGASPVMAYAKEEVADMATVSDALVLNIGTLTKENVESMIIAGKAANKGNTPVILDPVGAGATAYRTESVQKILNEVKISLMRGNAAEVAAVSGIQAEIKGVDAVGLKEDVVAIAKAASQKVQAPVVITGKKDVIANGDTIYLVANGHPLLTKVTGAGCLLSAVLAAFIAVEKDVVKACAAGLIAYGVAAEMAAEQGGNEGPGSFQIQLLNKLAQVNEEDILKMARIEKAGEFAI